MKRSLKFVLLCFTTLFLSVLFAGNTQAAEYKDVTYKYWAFSDIHFISDHRVVLGFSDGTFRPGEFITRKDATVMMLRALDLPEGSVPSTQALRDMNSMSPNYKQVMMALGQNWLTVKDGKFSPTKALTRDEMSKMLATAFSYEGTRSSSFKDVSKNSPYYNYIDGIAFHKVTTGYNDGSFRPAEKVTRAQFSAFLARVYQKPVAYEVKSGGETVAVVPSVEAAIQEVSNYADGTIHPQSNKFVQYAQTIATEDKTGINSGVLIYNGHNENNSFTPQFFDPYMRYEAVGGKKVSMFDTFIIKGLRYNASGEMFVDGPSNHADYADWNSYIDRTFAADGALENLNASARANERSADVYITIPYPKRGEDIIKLDGTSMDNNVYTRYDLAKWYINEVLHTFNGKNYANLNLKGFYWLSETVRTTDDEILISSISELVKKNDKFFFYSPHATSTNFQKWKDYGFDAAFLQPNAFRTAITNKEERLHRAFLNAQIYGTGITIEINSYGMDHVNAGEGVEAFDLYMDFSKRYGLDKKGMMFYQDKNMVYRMATIDHPVYKRWYTQLTDTFFSPQP